MSEIIGRVKEIKTLKKVKLSKKSEFVALYGRRRIGKTFLVRELFGYTFDFQLTGLANASTKQQLVNFTTVFRRQSGVTLEQIPKNWFEAFQKLIDHLEAIPVNRKKIIFFDELPWLDTVRSDFMMSLEHFWNSWATNRKDILLITCGSAAAWMIKKLINNHGGLHNRVTQRIKIHPFTLNETELMLKKSGHVLDRYQILQLYMVTGGIPYYLEAVETDKSVAQNIEELCFKKGALLATEFRNLFSSLFRNSEKYEQIISVLASKNRGLSRSEIIKSTKMKTGGSLTRQLLELEESGFITSYTPFSKKSKNTLYRLSDFYSLFYLKFLKNNTNYSEGVWINSIDSPPVRAWEGYTFEQICLAHIPQIKEALRIGGIVSNASSWQGNDGVAGAQVDLLIDRRDRVINLCEIKFSISLFKITKEYAQKLRRKISVFKNETGTKKSVFLTMITTYGLDENQHSQSLVQNEITMEALFQE